MAQLIVHNLDPDLVHLLTIDIIGNKTFGTLTVHTIGAKNYLRYCSIRAAEHGRSVEVEHGEILRHALQVAPPGKSDRCQGGGQAVRWPLVCVG